MDRVQIALPKGRLGEKAYQIFEQASFPCPAIREENRRLIFDNEELGLRFFWAKPSDVPIYVERGAADIGVVGRDILMEHHADVYDLLDLGIGRCRMMVSGYADFCDDRRRTLRVATKFPQIARDYYQGQCRDVDIIKLNGSIELAPILGLSDVIVDIVESGVTLKENGLTPLAHICDISAQLIANEASYKFKNQRISRICAAIAAVVQQSGQ